MTPRAVQDAMTSGLIGEAPASPAGPIGEAEAAELAPPPAVPLSRRRQLLQINQRQIEFVFRWRRQLGEVFRVRGLVDDHVTLTSHPDHVKSLFTADPALVPSLTAESPLRPIVGPNSVLTSNGARHLRQRKLLLPAFHGDAIDRYAQMIAEVTDREIERWPLDKTIQLAPRMQAITLEVIMSGIFGITGEPPKGTPEHGLKQAVTFLTQASTMPIAQVGELMNMGRSEPVGLIKRGVAILDRNAFAVISARRRADDLDQRDDILSMIMRATTEDGEPLSDRELRDELLTLVLAGFETTANSLAWGWERLTRNPLAYDRLRHAVRTGDQADEWIEMTIQETMRTRPVVPLIGRRVMAPWRLGDHVAPAMTPVAMSILLVHHREDLYPEPFEFKPERWVGHKPGTYEWIPFGGGTRRCLGASLAMAEMRVVLATMVRRLELEADRPEPEHALHRNVTMIPRRGARAVVRQRLA